MKYEIKDNHSCNFDVRRCGMWVASFCSKSDAEAWVASKRECVPLPEPVKHRCRRKSDGAEFSFCVMPCTDIAFIFLSNWERWSEKDFRAAFDILPECDQ